MEVEPVSQNGQGGGGARTLADLFRDEETDLGAEIENEEAVPIIEANESEFLVTVEYLDFVGPKLSKPEFAEEARP